MPAYYPVFLNLNNRRCLIVGGNNTSEEKAIKLLDHNATVIVVSNDVTPMIRELADDGRLDWIRRNYKLGDLENIFIAIVADTSNYTVNNLVYTEARQRNVPLNVVDVTNLCTWIAPAVVNRGMVTVAISTGGTSPALARKFREELSGTSKAKSTPNIMDLADLAPFLSNARNELSRRGIRINTDHWQACMTANLIDLIKSGEPSKANESLISNLLKGAECECKDGTCDMWEKLSPPSNSNPIQPSTDPTT